MAVSTEQPEPRALDDVLGGLRFAMVSTSAPDSDGLARPLTLLEHDAPLLRFLVSREAEWVEPLLSDEHRRWSPSPTPAPTPTCRSPAWGGSTVTKR